jgi:glucosamine-6-phosphate deaminase
MWEHLFDHVDIPDAQIHIPDGTLSLDEVPAYCEAFERAIADAVERFVLSEIRR